MSAQREELHELIDRLPEDEVAVVLESVKSRAATPSGTWPPPWFGAIRSGRTDTARRVDDLLAEGFGRS